MLGVFAEFETNRRCEQQLERVIGVHGWMANR